MYPVVALSALFVLLQLSGLSPTDYDLGVKYLNGQGVAKDEAQAAILFRKAADQGSLAAQDALRRLTSQQIAKPSPQNTDSSKMRGTCQAVPDSSVARVFTISTSWHGRSSPHSHRLVACCIARPAASQCCERRIIRRGNHGLIG